METVTLFLCGDVMTGRGIDQVLPHPSNPRIYESYLKDARAYVTLAEQTNGPFHKPVNFDYIWGDALEILKQAAPDIRLVNLETSVTQSNDYWSGKGINYRMHPQNIPCLTTANIDVCTLANNHVLDWGYRGLEETLTTLKQAGLQYAGAGLTLAEAQAPAVITSQESARILVFALADQTSGVPLRWKAKLHRPGVNFINHVSKDSVNAIQAQIQSVKKPQDIAIVSIHWGSNWGYSIPLTEIDFAHALVDHGDVDLIWGHSSHHIKGFEVYQGKLILYGCGDLINDYEGIKGYESYRDDLSLLYFASLDSHTGKLVSLQMAPMQMKQFRLRRATMPDVCWLMKMLNREGQRCNVQVEQEGPNLLTYRGAG